MYTTEPSRPADFTGQVADGKIDCRFAAKPLKWQDKTRQAHRPDAAPGAMPKSRRTGLSTHRTVTPDITILLLPTAFRMPMTFRDLANRATWAKIHLLIALALGLVFAVLGITGSLSIYRDEIDELLNPQLRVEPPQGGQMLSPDRIIAAVRAAHPNRNGVWTLEMPRTPHAALTAWFENPKESVDAYYAPLMVSVNPYTGEVLASRFWGQTFTTWILDLHTQLQLEGFGRNAVAAAGCFLFILTASGLALWWPGWRRLPSAFAVRHDAGLMRWLFDLHKLLGFCSAGVLLLLAFTGFHLAYPRLLESLTDSAGMGHGDAGPEVHSSGTPNNRPVSLTEAVLVARGLFPSADLKRITTPQGEIGTYRINLRRHSEINQHHPATVIWVDRWSGQIRDAQNPAEFTPGQTFTSWQWPLHTGEAFGGWGRFAWFLCGFMPMFLLASGGLHWLYRHGAVKDRPLDLAGRREAVLALLRPAVRSATGTAVRAGKRLLAYAAARMAKR